MYLRGEHSDPVKHSSAKKTENGGICHLTQQEPEADGAPLGRYAAGLFCLRYILGVDFPRSGIIGSKDKCVYS